MKCTKVKNPCKICFQAVTRKNGLQCQGACRKWAHYKCLNYTPGKIQDIKAGIIKVTCPCPDCNTFEPKEVLADPPFTCTNKKCPANTLPVCNSVECPSKDNPIPTYPPPPFEYSSESSPSYTRCPQRRSPSTELYLAPPIVPPVNTCPPRSLSPKCPSPPCPPIPPPCPLTAKCPTSPKCPPTPPKCLPTPPKCPPTPPKCPPLKCCPQSRKCPATKCPPSPPKCEVPPLSPGISSPQSDLTGCANPLHCQPPCIPICPPTCPSYHIVKKGKKCCTPKQSQSCSNLSDNSNSSGKPQVERLRAISSDSQVPNSGNLEEQKLLFSAIENLCNTVGQLSTQLRDLMCKMQQSNK